MGLKALMPILLKLKDLVKFINAFDRLPKLEER